MRWRSPSRPREVAGANVATSTTGCRSQSVADSSARTDRGHGGEGARSRPSTFVSRQAEFLGDGVQLYLVGPLKDAEDAGGL
jgi:hypothetical protein